MNPIPNIFFKGAREGIKGFEILPFSQLFNRKHIPPDHNPFELHRLSFFAVLIITEGQVRHRVDFEVCTLKAGDALVISDGQVHAFSQEDEYQGFLILFTEEFLYQNSAPGSIISIHHAYEHFLGARQFHCPEYNALLIDTLSAEAMEAPSKTRSLITGAALSMYLQRLCRQEYPAPEFPYGERSYTIFQQFRELLKQKYTQTRDAGVYASGLGITYKHLNTICRWVVGQTAKAFIDAYIVLEARRMLVTTSLSVKEICFQLGFDEPGNFQKYFKKHTQMTPAEFRKKTH